MTEQIFWIWYVPEVGITRMSSEGKLANGCRFIHSLVHCGNPGEGIRATLRQACPRGVGLG